MKVPPNSERRITMLNKNYTAKILDLEDVIVTNVEKNDIVLALNRNSHYGVNGNSQFEVTQNDQTTQIG